MLVNNLKIVFQTNGEPNGYDIYEHYPIEKIEDIIQQKKDLESELGYTAVRVMFDVYDYNECCCNYPIESKCVCKKEKVK